MRKVQKGVNDLKTWCLSNGEFGMQLMNDWTGEVDGKRNVDISDVARATPKRAKWICSNGHEWYATIASRTSQKYGCPLCEKEIRGEKVAKARLSEENSLKTWCLSNGYWGEQLISEWTGIVDDKENISIEDVSRASNKKAKWRCSKGHEWYATIRHRTRDRTGCPLCAKDRVSEENSLKVWCLSNGSFGEQLMSEWTGELEDKRNADISEVSYGSIKKAKWRCSKGHEWVVRVVDRTGRKHGCPYCAGNLVSDINSLKTWCLSNGSFGKQLMSEWTGIVDNKKDISIEEVSFGSQKKAKWKCSKGHEWFARINIRTSQKTGCPFCCKIGTSYPEQFIYHSLKQLYPNTENRCKVLKSSLNPKGIEFDIGVPELKLCIEYSPTFWHQGKEEKDEYKKQICKQYNVRLIHIVEDSFNELDFAMEPDYICFKMNNNQRDEILETIVDHILKTIGHSISEVDIEKVKRDAYESCKGIESNIQDNN